MAQILVVDDSAVVREGICDFLKSEGLTTNMAVDGMDALSKLKTDREVKLVITDINMPNMDGLTMAEKIRGELNNGAVKILVLTTENSATMKQRGKAAGVSGWIVKPFDPEKLASALRRVMH